MYRVNLGGKGTNIALEMKLEDLKNFGFFSTRIHFSHFVDIEKIKKYFL